MAFGLSSLNIPTIRAELRLLYALPMSGVQLFLENANQLALVSYPDPAAQFVLLRGEERFSAFAKVFWSSETPEQALAIADERPSLVGEFTFLGASLDLPTPVEISILSGESLYAYRLQKRKKSPSPTYKLVSSTKLSREELGRQVNTADGWKTTALRSNPRGSHSLSYANFTAYFFPWDQVPERDWGKAEKMNIPVDSLFSNPRTKKRFADLNIHYLGDILTKTRNELLDGKNFGKKTLRFVELVLMRHELCHGPYKRSRMARRVERHFEPADWWVTAMKEAHRRRREAMGIGELEI